MIIIIKKREQGNHKGRPSESKQKLNKLINNNNNSYKN